MLNETETEMSQWVAKYSCSQPGVQELNEWSVHGFYEDKFDDPWNLNLSENTVSLLTAIATSFSIILFVDIVFRVHVRAKNCRMTSQMVQRRLVLEDFSNPINLLSFVFRRVTGNRSAESADSRPGTPHHGLSKRTYVNLMFMGVLIVLIEFVLIFLATNQNKVHKLRLEAVPIFEFEDRGCEFLQPPSFVNTCDLIPLTEKSGFDSRATIQICSTNSVQSSHFSWLPNSIYFLVFNVQNVGPVQVTIMDRNRKSTQNTQMGIYVEQSRRSYYGMNDVRSKSLLSALLKRLKRTNITVLANSTIESIFRSETLETVDDRFQRLSLSNMAFRTNHRTSIGVSVVIDASNVDLRETHLSLSITGNEDENQRQSYMHSYLNDIMQSIMFPTGKARGVMVADENIFLDEDTDSTALAYYNRPWVGVVTSLIICCTLFLIWTVLAVLGIEGEVDSQMAWKTVFEGNEITNVDHLERGEYESQRMFLNSFRAPQ